ncbi:MAG: enoyl-CoA hydratase-related protein, partial [Lysobacterales bacterium]
MTSAIATSKQGAAVTITLDRAGVHNAFDDVLIAELTSALQVASADDSVRAVVLTGAGSTFSAGADVNWMRRMASASETDNRADSLKLAELMRMLNFLGKP